MVPIYEQVIEISHSIPVCHIAFLFQSSSKKVYLLKGMNTQVYIIPILKLILPFLKAKINHLFNLY